MNGSTCIFIKNPLYLLPSSFLLLRGNYFELILSLVLCPPIRRLTPSLKKVFLYFCLCVYLCIKYIFRGDIIIPSLKNQPLIFGTIKRHSLAVWRRKEGLFGLILSDLSNALLLVIAYVNRYLVLSPLPKLLEVLWVKSGRFSLFLISF